jgi:tetratricopeptide (TPR) repeat protein
MKGSGSTSPDPESWFLAGLAAVAGGRLDEAAHALLHAVELDPDALARGLTAARRLASAGSHQGAERILRRMLSQNAGRAEVRLALIELLLAAGQDRQALAEVARAQGRQPAGAELRLFAATAHERVGELDRAADQLALLLVVDENHLEANRRLAALLARTGDRQGALACWRRVVALGGAHPLLGDRGPGNEQASSEDLADTLARSGMTLLGADHLEQALAAFDHALAVDDGSAQAHLGLGLVYQRQGRWKEAAEAYRASERLDAGDPMAPLNLVLVLEQLGEREPARTALLRAAALAPEDARIRETLERLVPQASAGSLGSSLLPGMGLFDVLELLRQQRKSGSLAITSPRGSALVQLWRGSLTSASAPGGGPPQELEERLLDGRPLARLLFGQIVDALVEMASWPEGSYAFRPRDEESPPPVSFSIKHVLLELARRSDDSLGAASARRSADE